MRALDGLGVARALDDGGIVGVDLDLLGHAQVLELDLVELEAQVLHHGGRARQDRDVLEHRLAAIAVARGLDGGDVERAAELVDDERGERLAGDVLGNDEQRLLGGHHLFEDGDQLGHVLDLVLVDEDEALVELDLHVFGVGDEVGREIAAVELHALDDGDLGIEALALFDGDHAVLADLLERVGHDLADLGVVVGGDGGDVLNVGLALDGGGHVVDRLAGGLDGELHAADQRVGVNAAGDVLEPFAEEGFGQDGGGGRAVAGVVAGLAGGLLDEEGAHVFELVGELDFFGDRHAVLGDGGPAPGLVEHGIAAARPEGGLDRPRQLLNAGEQGLTSIHVEGEFFRTHFSSSK
jgi:hypothetical protein